MGNIAVFHLAHALDFEKDCVAFGCTVAPERKCIGIGFNKST